MVMRMNVEIIKSDLICDYCKKKYDYDGIDSCPMWFYDKLCDGTEFEGKKLIEASEE